MEQAAESKSINLEIKDGAYYINGEKTFINALGIARYRVGFVVLDSFGPPEFAADLRVFLQADPEQYPQVHRDSESGIQIFRVGTGP